MEINITYHTYEFKSRIIYIIWGLIMAGLVAYENKEKLLYLIAKPLIDKNINIIYTGVSEAFFTYIKISLFTSIYVNIPIIILHIVRYIKPGNYYFEQKRVKNIIKFGIIWFILGQIWYIKYLSPIIIEFFTGFIEEEQINLNMIAKISEYYNFVTQIIIGNMICFCIPWILLLIRKKEIIETIIEKRKYLIFTVLTIASIITPPDVISLILIGIPIILMWEISYFIINLENQYKKYK